MNVLMDLVILIENGDESNTMLGMSYGEQPRMSETRKSRADKLFLPL